MTMAGCGTIDGRRSGPPTRWPGFAALLLAAACPAPLAAAQQAPPRLAGVVVGTGHRAAIFASPDGSWVVAGEGDTVGGFTVLRIVPGGAEVGGPDNKRLLVPEAAPEAGSAAVPPSPEPATDRPGRVHRSR